MGTRPKSRPAPISFDLESAIKKVGIRALPKSPEMLSQIVVALLSRIEYSKPQKNKSREAARNWAILQVLAAIEQMRAGTPWPEPSPLYLLKYPIPVVEIDKLSRIAYAELARPNPSKREHLVITLQIQRNFLLGFMQHYGYQGLSEIPQEKWFLKTHGDHLFSTLHAFPCLCQYRGALKQLLYPSDHSDPLSEYDDVKGKYLAPAVGTIHYLLARLHKTSVSQVKALLKKTLPSGATSLLS